MRGSQCAWPIRYSSTPTNSPIYCHSEKKQPNDTSQIPWQHLEGAFEATVSGLIAGGENTGLAHLWAGEEQGSTS